jgi:hypothetical protein
MKTTFLKFRIALAGATGALLTIGNGDLSAQNFSDAPAPSFGVVSATPETHQASTMQGQSLQSQPIVGGNANPNPFAATEGEPSAEESAEGAAKAAAKKQAGIKKKIASSHKNVFYDNDFSYLCDSAYQGHQWGDAWKKRCLPGGGSYDIGGQTRYRAHFEQNMRGLGLTGVDDQFLLRRNRVYGDFRFTPDIRVFAEMLDADSTYENFGPRPIEENRFEMQNLFVDARLLAYDGGELTARVGRQEMQFGVQRLVSPLDWANTRRTFEGARLMWKRENMNYDAFWTNPVRVDDQNFDSPDRDQEFMGLYRSYTGIENQTIDTYTLRYLNGRGANNFKFNTSGVRWQGSNGNFLWDTEAAYQYGENNDGSDHSAGMATVGLGRKMPCRTWSPTLWTYYDWASGSNNTGAGNGFHHNLPLAHKYNGFMDLFGRRNLEDVNVQLSMQPSKKLKLLMWYHYLFLENKNDTPYSVAMTPFNAGNAPGSADLGHEIDMVATYAVSPRQQLLFGYSHFFSGDYYDTTPGVPFSGDASFIYSQWTVNY